MKEEVNTKLLTLKDNKTKEEYKVELDKIVEFLDEKMGDDVTKDIADKTEE